MGNRLRDATNLYDPAGSGRLEPVPPDFLTDLESLQQYGADVTDPGRRPRAAPEG